MVVEFQLIIRSHNLVTGIITELNGNMCRYLQRGIT